MHTEEWRRWQRNGRAGGVAENSYRWVQIPRRLGAPPSLNTQLASFPPLVTPSPPLTTRAKPIEMHCLYSGDKIKGRNHFESLGKRVDVVNCKCLGVSRHFVSL